jgi:aminoglycoside phosphotransferase (APT) family kinase protein
MIGKGMTSEVFSWGHGRVLKLFFDWRPSFKIERELKITRAIHRSGFPVPDALEIIEVEGRLGIVFECIEGGSLVDKVETKPWLLFQAARQLADLHWQMHGVPAPPELPSQHAQIEEWIEEAAGAAPNEMHQARRQLEMSEPGASLCHGDFHPANILLSRKGPVVIDWSRGTRGQPLADVARTAALFQEAEMPSGSPWHLRVLLLVSRTFIYETYLKRYLQLSGARRKEVEWWFPTQRAASLAWKVGEQTRNRKPKVSI